MGKKPSDVSSVRVTASTWSHALVRAIEALGTIQPTGPFERALARLLMAAYKRRLRAIVKVVPTWVGEEILIHAG